MRHRQRDATREFDAAGAVSEADRAGHHVHRRRTDKSGNENIVRLVVECERVPGLLHDAVFHHYDLVRHCHCLDLVVRDVDRCCPEPLVQFLDFGPHLHPELGVQVRQRLVEQEYLRVADNRAAHRDSLALAAGELAGIAVEELREAQDVGGFPDPFFDLVLALLGDHQGKGHVVAHRHMRVERVVLEHHRDVALLGRDAIDHPAADVDFACRDFLEPRDHPQQRRFPTARRADKHAEFAVGNLDVDAANHLCRAEILAHGADAYRCHLPPSLQPLKAVRRMICRNPVVSHSSTNAHAGRRVPATTT